MWVGGRVPISKISMYINFIITIFIIGKNPVGKSVIIHIFNHLS